MTPVHRQLHIAQLLQQAQQSVSAAQETIIVTMMLIVQTVERRAQTTQMSGQRFVHARVAIVTAAHVIIQVQKYVILE